MANAVRGAMLLSPFCQQLSQTTPDSSVAPEDWTTVYMRIPNDVALIARLNRFLPTEPKWTGLTIELHEIHMTVIENLWVKLFPKMTELKTLQLQADHIRSDHFAVLVERCTNVEKVELSGFAANDEDLKVMAKGWPKLQSLTGLDVGQCSVEGLQMFFDRLTPLKVFQLSGSFDKSSFESLLDRHGSTLTSLGWDDVDADLSDLLAAECVSLNLNELSPGYIWDSNIAYLQRFASLTFVDLSAFESLEVANLLGPGKMAMLEGVVLRGTVEQVEILIETIARSSSPLKAIDAAPLSLSAVRIIFSRYSTPLLLLSSKVSLDRATIIQLFAAYPNSRIRWFSDGKDVKSHESGGTEMLSLLKQLCLGPLCERHFLSHSKEIKTLTTCLSDPNP